MSKITLYNSNSIELANPNCAITLSQSGVINTEGLGTGDMAKATYDPQDILADAFARANHTGEQTISTITNLQASLDAKLDKVSTGWASYVDTQYTIGSPFALQANTTTVLPNNAGTTIDSQKPTDVTTFYDLATQKITGRNGDGLDMMIYFYAKPTQNDQWLDIWIDIGGSVGKIYDATFTFPKGNGVERGIMYAIPSAYTAITWQTNGGTVYVRSNHICNIYGIIYNFDRSHKAR